MVGFGRWLGSDPQEGCWQRESPIEILEMSLVPQRKVGCRWLIQLWSTEASHYPLEPTIKINKESRYFNLVVPSDTPEQSRSRFPRVTR